MGLSVSASPLSDGANAFEAQNLLPLVKAGYDNTNGLPVGKAPAVLPEFWVDRATRALPPRDQNASSSVPFNPGTDRYANTSVKAGDSTFNFRYVASEGVFNRARDAGTLTVIPYDQPYKPVRAEIVVPVLGGVNAKANVDSPENNAFVGVEAKGSLGTLEVGASLSARQPLSSVFESGRTLTDAAVSANLALGKDVSVGLALTRTTGGGLDAATRIAPSVTFKVGDDVKVQVLPSLTLTDKGVAQVGGALLVDLQASPGKPYDRNGESARLNSRTSAYGVVKFGETPLNKDPASLSVNVGISF